ncbi:hypothetical protein U9M48_017556 [Paspalum notatum var. saurae]|uniref:Uncharacterized protein n=1 Tax=Paspalum notatum var. saurae TaxID=547442 RepID=A0AAQ3WNR9_PASNO
MDLGAEALVPAVEEDEVEEGCAERKVLRAAGFPMPGGRRVRVPSSHTGAAHGRRCACGCPPAQGRPPPPRQGPARRMKERRLRTIGSNNEEKKRRDGDEPHDLRSTVWLPCVARLRTSRFHAQQSSYTYPRASPPPPPSCRPRPRRGRRLRARPSLRLAAANRRPRSPSPPRRSLLTAACSPPEPARLLLASSTGGSVGPAASPIRPTAPGSARGPRRGGRGHLLAGPASSLTPCPTPFHARRGFTARRRAGSAPRSRQRRGEVGKAGAASAVEKATGPGAAAEDEEPGWRSTPRDLMPPVARLCPSPGASRQPARPAPPTALRPAAGAFPPLGSAAAPPPILRYAPPLLPQPHTRRRPARATPRPVWPYPAQRAGVLLVCFESSDVHLAKTIIDS